MWSWFITTRFGRWVIGVAAIIAAFVVTWWLAHIQGANAQAIKDAKAQDASLAEAAQQTIDAAQARAGVEAGTSALPDAPAQKVAEADPASAAGKLRDDGWTRD